MEAGGGSIRDRQAHGVSRMVHKPADYKMLVRHRLEEVFKIDQASRRAAASRILRAVLATDRPVPHNRSGSLRRSSTIAARDLARREATHRDQVASADLGLALTPVVGADTAHLARRRAVDFAALPAEEQDAPAAAVVLAAVLEAMPAEDIAKSF